MEAVGQAWRKFGEAIECGVVKMNIDTAYNGHFCLALGLRHESKTTTIFLNWQP